VVHIVGTNRLFSRKTVTLSFAQPYDFIPSSLASHHGFTANTSPSLCDENLPSPIWFLAQSTHDSVLVRRLTAAPHPNPNTRCTFRRADQTPLITALDLHENAKAYGNHTCSTTAPGSTARITNVCLPAARPDSGIRARV